MGGAGSHSSKAYCMCKREIASIAAAAATESGPEEESKEPMKQRVICPKCH